MAEDAEKRTGRPSIYTDEIADTICERLINGESLRAICADEAMPSRATVLRWQEADHAFEAKCARARALQADFMDDLILDTALSCTPASAPADRVKIAAFQWRASKLSPKKYGEPRAAKEADDERDGGEFTVIIENGLP